jgi:predicted permease
MSLLADLRQDLRHGVRGLRRSPGFTAMVVVSLALGIGANAAIFSLLNYVFLQKLPVRDPDGLVLFAKGFDAGTSSGSLRRGPMKLYSYPLYQRLRAESAGLQGLAAQQSGGSTKVVRRLGPDGQELAAELADGRAVTANYFSLLGVRALLGRTFLDEDETAAGTNPVVVLSHTFWKRRLGGDATLIGAPLSIEGRRYTVIGVAAPGFVGTRVGVEVTDFWVPITMQAELMSSPLLRSDRDRWLVLVGRLAPGVPLAAVEASANVTLQRYLAEQRPPSEAAAARKTRIELASGARGISPLRQPVLRDPLLALMAGVALLLLVVCLSVSHLVLARAIQREREMTIRMALGAKRGRLVRQLLTEAALLAGLGGAAAAATTGWLTDGLLSLVPSGLPLALDVTVDVRVVLFASLLTLGTAVLVGLVPAFQASRLDLQQVLQGSSRAVAGGGRRLLGRLLLSSQVAVSLVLVVAAGLLSGSLARLRALPKGFDERHVLLAELKPHLTGLGAQQSLAMDEEILRRVKALPAVRAASMSTFPVLGGSHMNNTVTVPGTAGSPSVERAMITPDYFAVLGMTVVRGRSFTGEDRAGAVRVAVVNETMARRLLGGVDAALGKQISFDRGAELEVVGVVGDTKNNGVRDATEPMVFQPVAQHPNYLESLEVRADDRADPARLASDVRRALQEASPGLPVMGVRTMDSQVSRALTGERVLAALSSSFGAAALFLICIGLYGVISQWAGQRTREIGVRMALGATAEEVRWMVLRQAFLLVAAGMALGLPAAVAVSRLLRAFLYGVTPMDPATMIGAALILFAVATLAAYLPARRASRVDPMTALRCE